VIALLDNPIRPYDWGSRTAIARLQGRPSPTAAPEAELWIGAHPGAPSRLPDGTALSDRIAADPVGELGAPTVAELGPRLPFLAKVLAAERPLSLQVHPTLAQARAGFSAERAAGVPVGEGNYADDNHKPELICALTDFRGLAGFRPLDATRALLLALGVPELADGLTDGPARLVGELLRLDPARCRQLVATVAAGADFGTAGADFGTAGGEFAVERACAAELAAAYPSDPGVLVALLLNVVTLRPGEALFLPAGVPHAYLSGVGVEVMANSDNVLRGGLTSKRIDVPELLRLLDGEPGLPAIEPGIAVSASEWAYPTPAREFQLSRLSGSLTLPAGGPQIVLATAGSVTLERDGAVCGLAPGQAAYASASGGALDVRVTDPGTAFRVRTNLAAPGVA